MDSVSATPGARHPGHQFAAVLEKVQMAPASLEGVVHSAQCLTVRTLKVLPGNVLDSQFQSFGFTLKSAFDHSPLLAQSQCCGKKLFRCHLLIPVHPHQKDNSPARLPQPGSKAFALESPEARKRAKGCSRTQNSVTVLQCGAKPAQGRNEINGRGPPPAGRMPFMSDSTLNRRRAALCRLSRPNKVTHSKQRGARKA